MIEQKVLDRAAAIVADIQKRGNWVCFGAGKTFRNFVNRYCIKQRLLPKPRYACDNNQQLWGTEVCGVPVVSPEKLLEESEDKRTVITMGRISPFDMAAELFSYKWQRHYCFIIPLEQLDAYFYYMQHTSEIQKVFSYFEDNISKETYEGFWRLAIGGIMNFAEIYTPNAYWNNDIIPKLKDGWNILYGGAFDGKHIERALKNNKNILFHGFECNKKMYDQLVERYHENKSVKLYPYALNDKRETLAFCSDNPLGANIIREKSINNGKAGFETVVCTSIDEEITERLDFIAFDLEGSELQALTGAKNMIQAHKPILSICTYHCVEHYVKIPLYIKELNPQYKLKFRHHSVTSCESVLYAAENFE